ncbi:hypothetical protein [Clostridium beijerinckii]|uniref:hypothetical protein n=1 Tax=Clostridium beijerinckii TaxID=1520 RepID=UPI00047DBAEC|nr:hypothetical protein [Clostridium beijerinckii]
MAIFDDIQCIYSFKDKNNKSRDEKRKCMVILDKGYIKLEIIGIHDQFFMEEKILRQAFESKNRIETKGIYKDGENSLVLRIDININVLSLITSFYIVNLDNAIGISNFNLSKILTIS